MIGLSQDGIWVWPTHPYFFGSNLLITQATASTTTANINTSSITENITTSTISKVDDIGEKQHIFPPIKSHDKNLTLKFVDEEKSTTTGGGESEKNKIVTCKSYGKLMDHFTTNYKKSKISILVCTHLGFVQKNLMIFVFLL